MNDDHTAFTEFSNSHRPALEEALDRFSTIEGASPMLREAMRYSLLNGGKRMRPLLVLMACDLCGGNVTDALPAACAIEMVHTFSLIHDDLPAMDDDDLRRGMPSCHTVYGEAQAILAGDALLARAFEVLATELKPTVALRCTVDLARATGAAGMCGGQSDDVNPATTASTIEALSSLHDRKTGALIVAALRMGGHVASAMPHHMDALFAFGEHFGLAFQISDDLLDTDDGDVQSFPNVLGVDTSSAVVHEHIEVACKALSVFGSKADYLRSLAQFVLSQYATSSQPIALSQ